MIKLLGIVTVILFIITLGKFIYRRIPVLRKRKSELKFLVAIHPYSAGLLIISALIHGYMAFGLTFLFTGYALVFLIMLNLVLGAVLNYKMNKNILKVHRILSLFIIPFILLHNLYKYIL